MNQVIKPHYEDEDIQRLNLCSDVDIWKSEVKYIDQENKFFKRLFVSNLLKKADIKPEEIIETYQQLENLIKRNQKISKKLQEFFLELEGIRECDDLQCETFYLNSHQEFKVEIENYFYQNRNFKTHLYQLLEEGIEEFI